MRNKRKKRRIKPRAEVSRFSDISGVNILDVPLEYISIREWHPDDNAEQPPEEVHVILPFDNVVELGIRFKSPDTLGFIIEELIAYRKSVWQDADPVNPDVTMEDFKERTILDILKNMGDKTSV
ncbi:hypothetical protein J5I95_15885 [Candidatus Poribacteria bacterium]|nr:hypothetical protein [Candidatus Poribacteria bacterium]